MNGDLGGGGGGEGGMFDECRGLGHILLDKVSRMELCRVPKD
jgi:hypothetical protein